MSDGGWRLLGRTRSLDDTGPGVTFFTYGALLPSGDLTFIDEQGIGWGDPPPATAVQRLQGDAGDTISVCRGTTRVALVDECFLHTTAYNEALFVECDASLTCISWTVQAQHAGVVVTETGLLFHAMLSKLHVLVWHSDQGEVLTVNGSFARHVFVDGTPIPVASR